MKVTDYLDYSTKALHSILVLLGKCHVRLVDYLDLASCIPILYRRNHLVGEKVVLR